MEDDEGRRTDLAVERTQLAWWRTGLTGLAVAIGVGRVVPELSESERTWPYVVYVVAGILFGLYGLALFLQGTARGRSMLPAESRNLRQGPLTELLLAAAGPILAIVVIALITTTG